VYYLFSYNSDCAGNKIKRNYYENIQAEKNESKSNERNKW